MRTVSLITLTMAVGLTCFAANSIEATYTVGNLDGLSAGAKGVLRSSDNALVFRSGSVTVEASYAKITGTELGQNVTRPHDATKHKFLGKMFSDRTARQNLTINFKNAAGQDQSMTLELSAPDAQNLDNLLGPRPDDTHDTRGFFDFPHTSAASRQDQDAWWGDGMWRTDRNQKSWDTQTASAK